MKVRNAIFKGQYRRVNFKSLWFILIFLNSYKFYIGLKTILIMMQILPSINTFIPKIDDMWMENTINEKMIIILEIQGFFFLSTEPYFLEAQYRFEKNLF